MNMHRHLHKHHKWIVLHSPPAMCATFSIKVHFSSQNFMKWKKPEDGETMTHPTSRMNKHATDVCTEWRQDYEPRNHLSTMKTCKEDWLHKYTRGQNKHIIHTSRGSMASVVALTDMEAEGPGQLTVQHPEPEWKVDGRRRGSEVDDIINRWFERISGFLKFYSDLVLKTIWWICTRLMADLLVKQGLKRSKQNNWKLCHKDKFYSSTAEMSAEVRELIRLLLSVSLISGKNVHCNN